LTSLHLRHPGIHPFSGCDVNTLLDARAEARSDHPLLIWAPFGEDHRTWTYADFAHDSKRLAAGLAARGVAAGERVLIHMENCPEILLAWYACARIGAIAVTTNARAAGPELAYFADHAEAVCVLTQPKFADLAAEHCPGTKWTAVTGTAEFDALYGDAEAAPSVPIDPMREVGIQYTSGTTSRPKGVVWTHANALWGFRVNALHMGLTKDDVHLLHMPLFHTNAQAYSFGGSLHAGGSCVVMPRFSARNFWPTALKHGCTWASMNAFSAKALMAHPVPEDHKFRLWGSAVAEPPWDQHFGVRTIGWWGMTETMTHGIVSDHHQRARSMMIGRAAPEYEVAVLDDAGAPAAFGAVGHLFIRGIPGLSLFKEYLSNPDATAAAYDDDGWFITGDRVVLHEDGFIQFANRDKDMLRVGGENVAASEIEAVAMQLADVREVAVVAQKDEMRDELPVIFVLPEGGLDAAAPDLAERVLEACRAALADFKVPRAVHLVDDFPRSTLDKIAKAELRKRLEDGAS